MGDVRKPITKQQWALLLFGLLIGVPLVVKWQEGTKPFGPAFGLSYPTQLLVCGILGAFLALMAYGQRGKVLRPMIFGLVSVPVFVLAIEAYLSARSTVFHLELAVVAIAIVFFAPFVLLWKFIDRRVATPDDHGRHDQDVPR